MGTATKHLIWDHWGYLNDDMRNDIKEEHPEFTDSQVADYAYELNQEYLKDEYANLGKIFKDKKILMIGNIQLWDGGRQGAKFFESLPAAMNYHGMESAEYYVDISPFTGKYETTGRYGGHDDPMCSTFLYMYLVKDNLNDRQHENLLNIINKYCTYKYRLTETLDKLKYYVTNPSQKIADIYGWELKKETKNDKDRLRKT